MRSTHVTHPILRLQVLMADGTRVEEHRVFCRLERRSVHVEECCSCVHCDGISDGSGGSGPSVDCTIPAAPSVLADDTTGDRTEVATLLCIGTVVVAASAPLHVALALLRSEDRRAVAIVDDHHQLIGLVHEMGFLGQRSGSRFELRAAMSTAIAIHEATPVRAALRLLAASHLREATVVSSEGTPIGLFRDIDGLRWIAKARPNQVA